jgi:hypothetical protein
MGCLAFCHVPTSNSTIGALRRWLSSALTLQMGQAESLWRRTKWERMHLEQKQWLQVVRNTGDSNKSEQMAQRRVLSCSTSDGSSGEKSSAAPTSSSKSRFRFVGIAAKEMVVGTTEAFVASARACFDLLRGLMPRTGIADTASTSDLPDASQMKCVFYVRPLLLLMDGI